MSTTSTTVLRLLPLSKKARCSTYYPPHQGGVYHSLSYFIQIPTVCDIKSSRCAPPEVDAVDTPQVIMALTLINTKHIINADNINITDPIINVAKNSNRLTNAVINIADNNKYMLLLIT